MLRSLHLRRPSFCRQTYGECLGLVPFLIVGFDYQPGPVLEVALFVNGVLKTLEPLAHGLQSDHFGARGGQSHQQQLAASKGCIIEAGT